MVYSNVFRFCLSKNVLLEGSESSSTVWADVAGEEEVLSTGIEPGRMEGESFGSPGDNLFTLVHFLLRMRNFFKRELMEVSQRCTGGTGGFFSKRVDIFMLDSM